ncbi:MAG: N-acetylmuramoyl-L-alanine amidase [Deltaproteobacteria bacterium]|nr:N-acetylmuramoyl-L-alanine amidase [Deltaproteobacteria bacterium]
MSAAIDTLIVAGADVVVPAGLRVRNYRDPDVTRFKGRDRSGRAVTELILHETVTRSTAATVRVLLKRKLGVQLIVGPDGEVTQHGDLAHDRLAHAGGHNGPSVGIEVVNPYYPKYASAKLPWKRTINAPWAHQQRYVVPTPEQAEATAQLVQLLTSGTVDGLSIPRAWRGISGTRFAMSRISDGDQRVPGIYAHTYFHHADGAWLTLYAWLRLEAGMPECIAYEEAIRRATGVRRHVDLSDLIPQAVA